jgi:hypothetical protein
MSQAGTLTGLEGLRQGRNLQLKPAMVGGHSSGAQVPASALGSSFDASLDLKYGMTPSLTLDATVNTDFSQVEVDQEQVNLTRFSLFFQERREFFVENAGVFAFGDLQERNYRMGASPGDFTFFNSRQIGLSPDGRPIPILGGVRMTGKVGSFDTGLLNMQTEGALGRPAENFSVIRFKRNIFGNSDVGILLANRMATEGPDLSAQSYGVDANLRPASGLAPPPWSSAAAGREKGAPVRARRDRAPRRPGRGRARRSVRPPGSPRRSSKLSARRRAAARRRHP